MRGQLVGFISSIGAWFVNNVTILNQYLEFISFVIGVTIGVWALVDKIKKVRKKNAKNKTN